MPLVPGANTRLQEIIELLKCHILHIGCADFVKFDGETLDVSHMQAFGDSINALHFDKGENMVSQVSADFNSNKTSNIYFFNPSIDNGLDTPKGRILEYDLNATALGGLGRQLLGVVSDRGVIHNDETIWAVYYDGNGDDTNGRVFVQRFDLLDNDGTTWASGSDTILPIGGELKLGSRGQFGGTSGVAPFNLTPADGWMVPLGVYNDGTHDALVCGASTYEGQHFMLFYNLSNGDLIDIGGSGTNRPDASGSLGTAVFEDGVQDTNRAVRSLFPLYSGFSTIQAGQDNNTSALCPWSPLIIDDDRQVFIFSDTPCSYFGGSPGMGRGSIHKQVDAREFYVTPQLNIRNRLDSFKIKDPDPHILKPHSYQGQGTGFAKPIKTIGAYDIGANEVDNTLFKESLVSMDQLYNDFPAGLVSLSSVNTERPRVLAGFRNVILTKKDLVIDGVTLNDQSVLIAGGNAVYLFPNEYVPNGFKLGSPV